MSRLLATSRWVRPNLAGPRAVDVEAQLGRVDDLVDMHVGRARDAWPCARSIAARAR